VTERAQSVEANVLDGMQALQTTVSAGREEVPELLRQLGEQGQASISLAVKQLKVHDQGGQMTAIREIQEVKGLTGQLLQRTADLHAQAASIEQNQAEVARWRG
jgi:hypothetical protein